MTRMEESRDILKILAGKRPLRSLKLGWEDTIRILIIYKNELTFVSLATR